MTFSFPLVALLAARRNDSDAGRTALIAMMFKPPILGLAIGLANRPPKLVPKSSFSQTVPGGTVIDSVVPKPDHPLTFFPSFLDLSKDQAIALAELLELEPTFVEDEDLGARETVKKQQPRAGSNWARDQRTVKLHLT